MQIEELFGVVAALAFFAFLIYLPIRFFILIGQVKSLEQRFLALADRMPITPSAKPSEPAVPAPVAPAAVPVPPVAPPPLPARTVSTAPARVLPDPEPDPLFARLRDLGLLPPADLKGEYALGAWWAVRVGGLLAVAAVVFLGIWLNLRSTIPPFVRVLEVALVGAGLFWGGVRLSAQRKDLGEVLAAAGLAVWQFAAWATYGLDKMRLFEGPAQAALVQFIVAAVVAALALWRGSKLFGQLAVVFAAVAVYFSIGIGTEPWPTAIGAGLVALLGVILMVRGPWGSAGVLGLVGSQACLLFLYDAMPTKDANYLSLQLAALGSFLALWVGERLVKDDTVLLGRDARSAFQLASFFAPAFLSLFLATGGEHDRATVALLIAAVAAIAGYVEQLRNRLVSEVLLLAAVGFVGAGLAWLVDPHLVWLIWALAAAATLVVGTRTRSELVRWSSEALAGVAFFAFIDHPPAKPWMGLAGIAAFGLLLGFREDWDRVSGWQQLRRVLGILGVAGVVLAVQQDLPKADSGWPWVVLLLVAALRFRPALLWAAVPAYLLTSVIAVFWRPLVGGVYGWAAIWSALVIAINVFALWRLIGREESGNVSLRYVLACVTAVVAYAFCAHLAGLVFTSPSDNWSPHSWRLAAIWSLGGAMLVALTTLWRRLGANPADLSLSAFGALVGFVIQGVVATGAGITKLGLPHAPFILLGLAGLLHVLAVHTKEQGGWGAVQRAVLGAVTLLIAYVMLAFLPGAGVSLFWALAALLTFVLGHLLATRSFRMIGLVGLGVATMRVLSHDITDLLGRIAACGAMAVAFFGIAWLYGRITSDQRNG
ncbi:MAG: DUF2339 domain-containing protein [Opitutales bacterium]